MWQKSKFSHWLNLKTITSVKVQSRQGTTGLSISTDCTSNWARARIAIVAHRKRATNAAAQQLLEFTTLHAQLVLAKCKYIYIYIYISNVNWHFTLDENNELMHGCKLFLAVWSDEWAAWSFTVPEHLQAFTYVSYHLISRGNLSH